MKPLEFLLGTWQGDGGIKTGPGGLEGFRQRETVESKLNGRLVVIEGLGTSEGQDGGPDVVVHEAFGVISWSATENKYRFSAYRRDGAVLDTEPKILENQLEWGFKDVQGGTIRFTIQRTEGDQWFEVGERSVDGVSWFKFFEMTLNRVE